MNDDKQDWNINEAGSKVVGELIQQVNQAMTEGDSMKSLNILTILYNNIAGHKKVCLLEKENKEISILREECFDLIHDKKPITDAQIKYMEADKKLMKSKLLDLHRKIMDLMHKSEMWFTVFEKDTRKAIKRGF